MACVAGLSGCGTIQGTTTPISQLRIVDASPDAGGIDVYANSSPLAYNIGFGTTTSYVPATPGTYTVSADTAGTRTALATTRATLANNKQYTLVMNNVAASLGLTLLTDQNMPAPSGFVSVRLLMESMNVGAVDIYLVPQGTPITNVFPVAQNVTFQQNTGYLNVPTGTYTLYAVPAGSVLSSTLTPIYVGPPTALNAGSAETVIFFDKLLVTTPAFTVSVLQDYVSPTATQ